MAKNPCIKPKKTSPENEETQETVELRRKEMGKVDPVILQCDVVM